MTSHLKTLGEAGQAVWLDFIDRRFLADDGLRRLFEDGLTSVTSNPSIFEREASFGTVQIAQARGDLDVLAARGRRVLRVCLRKAGGGIEALRAAVAAAVRSN